MKRIINYRITSILSKVTLLTGIAIILSSLIYMILNLAHADNFIVGWAFSMAIGVAFSLISVLLNMMIKSSAKKSVFS